MAKTKSAEHILPCKVDKSLRIKPISRERNLIIQGSDGNVLSRGGTAMDRIPPGIYRWNMTSSGMYFNHVKPCEDSFEPTTIQKQIMDNVAEWICARDIYHQHGMSWKRGWLMHGKPGCGKTATMRMLAKRSMELGAVVLDARNLYELDDAISHALASVQNSGAPVLVLMEDIDKMGDNSELTEFLDGIGSNDGLGFIGSTNYLDHMSERILREGRFDEKIELSPPSFEDKSRYLDQFGISGKKKDLQKLSMAELRELVIKTNVLKKK